jgi:hypothetical protein
MPFFIQVFRVFEWSMADEYSSHCHGQVPDDVTGLTRVLRFLSGVGTPQTSRLGGGSRDSRPWAVVLTLRVELSDRAVAPVERII